MESEVNVHRRFTPLDAHYITELSWMYVHVGKLSIPQGYLSNGGATEFAEISKEKRIKASLICVLSLNEQRNRTTNNQKVTLNFDC